MTALTDAAPTDLAAAWGGTSHFADLDGPVHWVDFGSPQASTGAPPVVLVHGLGGSHLNWVGIGSELARTHRVVALDLAGFGLEHPLQCQHRCSSRRWPGSMAVTFTSSWEISPSTVSLPP